ncbi:hypothetical protein MRX96_005248 [Rhipicephalus microplus]
MQEDLVQPFPRGARASAEGEGRAPEEEEEVVPSDSVIHGTLARDDETWRREMIGRGSQDWPVLQADEQRNTGRTQGAANHDRARRTTTTRARMTER